MEHSKHSQIVRITNLLIIHYRCAMQADDSNAKRKIVMAKKTLYRYKKYYYAEER